MKTVFKVFGALIVKHIEFLAGGVAIILNHISLTSNKMIIMEPIQSLFNYILILKTIELIKLFLSKEERKIEKSKAFFLQFSLETVVCFYISILDNIRLTSFADSMSPFYHWLLIDNKLLGEIIPYILLFFWMQKRRFFEARNMINFMYCFYLNYILMGIFILFRWF